MKKQIGKKIREEGKGGSKKNGWEGEGKERGEGSIAGFYFKSVLHLSTDSLLGFREVRKRELDAFY